MLYAIPYNHPAAIPVGILLVYVTLFIVRLFSKYAIVFQPEGSQQTDLAIQEDTSSTEGTPKRSKSSDELFQQNSGSPGKTTFSGGDPTTVDITRATETTTTAAPKQLITLQPRTRTAKDTFVQNYPKTMMAQLPDHQTEDIYPSKEEILSMTDYMKVVQAGRILKGHNHQQIEDLAKLPHPNQTKFIVLTYEMRKKPEQQEQHKST